ncbi:radical SAM protein [Desulfurobacterium thermolithotrophum]|uniref:radical SAM protein n=1 Tax=Desulfurobacterium thermolithotrophum TaxID=64160 RepID=UPI0013D6FC6D|nr:radical SAM protein [Desulfurobacterium thermolithotrophum]
MKVSPFLDVETPITFRDQPSIQSAVLYTEINLCNLNCYHCHNRHGYNEYKGKREKLSYKKLKEKLLMLKALGVELIIISGGEPTLEKKLEEGLRFIRSLGLPVRVDTNGTNPEVIQRLIEESVVDGFAVDIKIPLKVRYTPQELKRFKRVLFSTEDVDDGVVLNYSKKLMASLEIIKKNPLQYTVFRTVEYPLLLEEDKNEIRKLLEFSPHQFNPFYPVEEE